MRRHRIRKTARCLLEAAVMLIIVCLYLIVFSRGQIIHGRML